MSDAAIKGSTATEISFRLHFAIPQATYKLTPTGGVTNPIARFTIITTPRCTKSIPKLFATGTKSGTNIYNADVESKKHPAIKSIIFTIIKNPIRRNKTTSVGISPKWYHENVSKVANVIAKEIKQIIIPVIIFFI